MRGIERELDGETGREGEGIKSIMK